MAVYLVSSYNVFDFETFKNYPPRIAALIAKHGGKVLALEMNPESLQGKAKNMNSVLEFPTEKAIQDLYNDDDYHNVIAIRDSAATDCTMVIVKGVNHNE
jgi:uncharacterized protein (DUF1330 family)